DTQDLAQNSQPFHECHWFYLLHMSLVYRRGIMSATAKGALLKAKKASQSSPIMLETRSS
ncbi:MAG: hypothetical protein ACW7DN_12900, partial [Paraglaciecola chathamensis]